MTTPAGLWAAPIRNFNGDVVAAQQILVGTEARVADLQRQLAAARAEIAALTAKVEGISPGPVTVTNPPVDLRALAATVADVLAERLRG
jgi:outer membrane protein TolC